MVAPKLVTVDFETFYSREYSLTRMTTEAYIRDPQFQIIGVGVKVDAAPTEWHSFVTLEEYRSYLTPILQGNFLLCHNTAFDGAILGFRLGIHPLFLFDTMAMATPENQMGVGVSLKALASKYSIGEKGQEVILSMGKRLEDFTTEELHRYGEYCKNDVELTYLLFSILKEGFPRQEMKVINLLLQMYTNPVLELDVDVLKAHLSSVQAKKAATLATVELICDKASLMSNQKFSKVLEGFGVEPPRKVSPTTGKETYAFSKTDLGLRDLLEHEDLRVQAVVSARLGVKSTIEETRAQAFLGISKRGLLPVPLKYYAAHTGRVGGCDGINLQNLPRGGELRRAIVAPSGHSLVACDSAQIEARVLAWLAGEKELVEAFARGEDVYSQFASTVYGREVTKKSDPVARHVAKTAILGLGYGMGPDKFKSTLKTSKPAVEVELQDAMVITATYRRTYPNIKNLWSKGEAALAAVVRGVRTTIGNRGVLCTSGDGIHLPNGMLLRYPNLTLAEGNQYVYTKDRRQIGALVAMRLEGKWDLDKLTRIYGGKCVENCVQALARITVFDQMVEISRRYRVSHTVHDEVVVCVPDAEVEDAKAFMLEVMSVAPSWAPGLPIACEAGVGKNYADAK